MNSKPRAHIYDATIYFMSVGISRILVPRSKLHIHPKLVARIEAQSWVEVIEGQHLGGFRGCDSKKQATNMVSWQHSLPLLMARMSA